MENLIEICLIKKIDIQPNVEQGDESESDTDGSHYMDEYSDYMENQQDDIKDQQDYIDDNQDEKDVVTETQS